MRWGCHEKRLLRRRDHELELDDNSINVDVVYGYYNQEHVDSSTMNEDIFDNRFEIGREEERNRILPMNPEHKDELWLYNFCLKNNLSREAYDDLREWSDLVRFFLFRLIIIII